MKPAFFLFSLVFLFSCRLSINKTVEGNANIKTEQRNVSGFTGISVAGPFQVMVQQGNTFSVSVETDENLMQYIEIKREGSSLEIRERDGFNLRGTRGLKVTVQLPEVNGLSIAGSGVIEAQSSIKNTDQLEFNIAGSGKINATIDAPEIKVEIAGSGTANLSGQTRKMKVSIGGSGDCLAEDLKSEDCTINIAGSGAAKVFASTSLDVSIGGSGDVYYGGSPTIVRKSVAGSGKIKEL